MKLYNTLTKQIDTIQPIVEGKIGMYTCGPTVYDYAHIGHWFTYIRMDTLYRALQAEGYDITWVMNITDVGHLVSDADEGEDKLEKGAKREGKTAWQVAEFYTQDFLVTMELLGISKPTHIVKATDHIADQINLIERLEKKGFSYVIDDGVYYDTSKFEGYKAFANLDLDEQQGSGRVEQNLQKKAPSDFALWKFSPAETKRDMEWPSPWGTGFPGWHIECSAMSMAYLGETLDVHTGGIDHIPVHHTNEIAQSEAATGMRFANYWMHSNHLMVEGQKISKSLNNGTRAQELIEKGFTPDAIRLEVLQSHYRSQSKFTLESLQASVNRLQHWYQVADLYWQPIPESSIVNKTDESIGETIKTAAASVHMAITSDLDTPLALRHIDGLFSTIEITGIPGNASEHFKEFLQYIYSILGIQLHGPNASPDVKELLDQRALARSNKDWQSSDNLRDQLSKLSIGIKDNSTRGQTWHRI